MNWRCVLILTVFLAVVLSVAIAAFFGLHLWIHSPDESPELAPAPVQRSVEYMSCPVCPRSGLCDDGTLYPVLGQKTGSRVTLVLKRAQ